MQTSIRNRLKVGKKNLVTILGAVLGIALTALYFVFVERSPLVRYMRPKAEKQDIVAAADSFFKELPGNHESFQPHINILIDNEMLRFAQYYLGKNKEFPGLAVGYWHISWSDKEDAAPETKKDNIYVRYDFYGNLVGFKKSEKDLEMGNMDNLSEDDAYLEVIYFLQSLNLDTRSLVIANKEKNEKGKKIKYRFTLKNKLRQYPAIIETYTVEITGRKISFFQSDKTSDPAITGDLGSGREGLNNIGNVFMTITWVVVAFMLMVQFIGRLRRDELEFKRAFRLSIIIASSLIIIALLQSNGSILSPMVFMLVASFFLGLLILIVFPAAESQCREAWPEKLAVIDLVLEGKVWVRETGAAILRSFFLTGISLFFFGGLLLLTTSRGIGYILFNTDANLILPDLSIIAITFLKNFWITIFAGFTIFCFWPAYLKTRFSNRALIFAVLTLTLVLFGLNLLYFRPFSLSALMFLPIAMVWAMAMMKFELLTLLLSIYGVAFFMDLPLVLIDPVFFYTLPGMAIIIGTALVLLLGIYLLLRSRSAGDFDDYIPEYVGRITEKERILKELEIARSVQMRFLPQRVPQLPNLEIASVCRPAMQVGGDYYDFIELDDRYLSVLIGDVSGKGVSAAFYMTMIKGIIKTLARKITEPAVLLSEANDIFYENASRGTFITVIYGIFDLTGKTLTIASAGHNPLIGWKNGEQESACYNPQGIALGLRSGEAFRTIIKELTVPFEAGDIFVFYTDGVTEAMNMEQEIFGEERLRTVIENNSGLTPQALETAIIEAVTQFSGEAPQHDDFTMVIVKIKEKNS